MIDFNTVLNVLLDQVIEQAASPLVKRIVELEEQVKNTQGFGSDEFVEAVRRVLWTPNYESDEFAEAVRAIAKEEVEKHEEMVDHVDMGDYKFRDAVKDVVCDMTFNVSAR
jgi:hypothetical protein